MPSKAKPALFARPKEPGRQQRVTKSPPWLARPAHLDISCRGRDILHQQGLEDWRGGPHSGDAHCCRLGLHIADHIPGDEPHLVGHLIAQVLVH